MQAYTDLTSQGLDLSMVEEIVVTNEYEKHIALTNERYNVAQNIFVGRGLVSTIKSISNFDYENELYTIVIRDFFFLTEDWDNVFFEFLINIHCKNELPNSLRKIEAVSRSAPYPNVITFWMSQWIVELITVNTCGRLGYQSKSVSETSVNRIYNFRRSIKNIHFEYQASRDVAMLWGKIIDELNVFIKAMISIRAADDLKHIDQNIKLILLKLLNTLDPIAENVNNYHDYIDSLRNPIRDLLFYCNVDVTADDPVYVKVLDHPKSMYKDLLDTESRIVAFVDILGFGQIVDAYEIDPSADTLRRLHRALSNAIAYGINIFKKSDPLFDKTLQYKLFSDCLCISTPYYNNDDDFVHQFSSLAQILRFYQLFMLYENFFVRGAISFGSFYADDNMIFSTGLVKAYRLESEKAIHPRIIVDPEIMTRCGNTTPQSFYEQGISDLFIVDKVKPDYAFINPFNIYEGLEESTQAFSDLFDQYMRENELLELKDLGSAFKDIFLNIFSGTKNMFGETYDKENFLKDLLVEVDHRIKFFKGIRKIQIKYKYFKRVIQYNLGENESFKLYFDQNAEN